MDGPVVFFGDAPPDQAAAVAAGVRFVAVNPNDHLRPHVGEWAADFSDLAQIRRLAGLPTDLEISSRLRLSSARPMLAQGHG